MRPLLLTLWFLGAAITGGCAPPAGPPAASAPGVEPGQWVHDIRAIDPEPRLTLVTALVREVRWPWVLLASDASDGATTYWVNFNHVCLYRTGPAR